MRGPALVRLALHSHAVRLALLFRWWCEAAYDLALLWSFSKVKPPEELKPDRTGA